MEKPLVLIADGDPEFRSSLAEALREGCCVRCCDSGQAALALMRKLKPDILVLDLMLPELDGFGVLQAALAEGLRPGVLATTPLSSEYIQTTAEGLGIDYLMRKPCNIPAMVCRIGEIGRRPKASRPSLSAILRELGFSPTLRGTRILPVAAARFAQDPDQQLTKEFYPEVGKHLSPEASGDQVEKWLRYAIEKAWTQGNRLLWNRHFPQEKRPSNREFLLWLVQAATGERAYL